MIKAKHILLTRFFVRSAKMGKLLHYAPLGLQSQISELIHATGEPITQQRQVAKKEMWKVYFVLPQKLNTAVDTLLPYEKTLARERAYVRDFLNKAWAYGNPKAITRDEMATLQRAAGDGPWAKHYPILLTGEEYIEMGGVIRDIPGGE